MKYYRRSLKILAGATLSCFVNSSVGFSVGRKQMNFEFSKIMAKQAYEYELKGGYKHNLAVSYAKSPIVRVAVLWALLYFLKNTMIPYFQEQRVLQRISTDKELLKQCEEALAKASESLESFDIFVEKFKKDYLPYMENFERYKTLLLNELSEDYLKVCCKWSKDTKKDTEKAFNKVVKKFRKKVRENKELRGFISFLIKCGKLHKCSKLDELMEDLEKKSGVNDLREKIVKMGVLRDVYGITGNVLRKCEITLPKNFERLNHLSKNYEDLYSETSLKKFFIFGYPKLSTVPSLSISI